MASEGDTGIERCFSLLRTILLGGLPDGPRTDGHRFLFATAADEVQRSCAVLNRSPVDETHSTRLHHELQTSLAAHTAKSVSLAVRGAAAEVVRDESGTVPQPLKGCYSFWRTDEHSP